MYQVQAIDLAGNNETDFPICLLKCNSLSLVNLIYSDSWIVNNLSEASVDGEIFY